jgi:hypothetical protein
MPVSRAYGDFFGAGIGMAAGMPCWMEANSFAFS